MRAKAAKTGKKSKGAAVRGSGGDGSGGREQRSGGRGSKAEGREKASKEVERSRVGVVDLGIVGADRPWSVQPGVPSQAKDRSVAPPALPVPIASFII